MSSFSSNHEPDEQNDELDEMLRRDGTDGLSIFISSSSTSLPSTSFPSQKYSYILSADRWLTKGTDQTYTYDQQIQLPKHALQPPVAVDNDKKTTGAPGNNPNTSSMGVSVAVTSPSSRNHNNSNNSFHMVTSSPSSNVSNTSKSSPATFSISVSSPSSKFNNASKASPGTVSISMSSPSTEINHAPDQQTSENRVSNNDIHQEKTLSFPSISLLEPKYNPSSDAATLFLKETKLEIGSEYLVDHAISESIQDTFSHTESVSTPPTPTESDIESLHAQSLLYANDLPPSLVTLLQETQNLTDSLDSGNFHVSSSIEFHTERKNAQSGRISTVCAENLVVPAADMPQDSTPSRERQSELLRTDLINALTFISNAQTSYLDSAPLTNQHMQNLYKEFSRYIEQLNFQLENKSELMKLKKDDLSIIQSSKQDTITALDASKVNLKNLRDSTARLLSNIRTCEAEIIRLRSSMTQKSIQINTLMKHIFQEKSDVKSLQDYIESIRDKVSQYQNVINLRSSYNSSFTSSADAQSPIDDIQTQKAQIWSYRLQSSSKLAQSLVNHSKKCLLIESTPRQKVKTRDTLLTTLGAAQPTSRNVKKTISKQKLDLLLRECTPKLEWPISTLEHVKNCFCDHSTPDEAIFLMKSFLAWAQLGSVEDKVSFIDELNIICLSISRDHSALVFTNLLSLAMESCKEPYKVPHIQPHWYKKLWCVINLQQLSYENVPKCVESIQNLGFSNVVITNISTNWAEWQEQYQKRESSKKRQNVSETFLLFLLKASEVGLNCITEFPLQCFQFSYDRDQVFSEDVADTKLEAEKFIAEAVPKLKTTLSCLVQLAQIGVRGFLFSSEDASDKEYFKSSHPNTSILKILASTLRATFGHIFLVCHEALATSNRGLFVVHPVIDIAFLKTQGINTFLENRGHFQRGVCSGSNSRLNLISLPMPLNDDAKLSENDIKRIQAMVMILVASNQGIPALSFEAAHLLQVPDKELLDMFFKLHELVEGGFSRVVGFPLSRTETQQKDLFSFLKLNPEKERIFLGAINFGPSNTVAAYNVSDSTLAFCQTLTRFQLQTVLRTSSSCLALVDKTTVEFSLPSCEGIICELVSRNEKNLSNYVPPTLVDMIPVFVQEAAVDSEGEIYACIQGKQELIFLPWLEKLHVHGSILYFPPDTALEGLLVNYKGYFGRVTPGNNVTSTKVILKAVYEVVDHGMLEKVQENILLSCVRFSNIHGRQIGDKNVLSPLILTWIAKGAKEVRVCGSFDKWKGLYPLIYSKKYSYFSCIIHTQPGRFHYRFFVDGAWTVAPDQPIELDNYGCKSNVAELKAKSEVYELKIKPGFVNNQSKSLAKVYISN